MTDGKQIMVPVNETAFMGWRTDEPFIFVSYAREDCHFVYPEIERLKVEGYRIWYDKEQIRPVRTWPNEINEATAACACFLVFITKRAVESERVIGEIRQALSLNKPLIVIYWQKVTLPPDLQDQLQRIQGLEFYDLHRPSYESHLGRALSESVEAKPRSREKNDDFATALDVTSSHIARGISPKLICLILILVGVGLSFFAIVGTVVFLFGSLVLHDPLARPFHGFIVGSLFLAIAIGLFIVAFAVYRKYLGRK